MLTLLNYLRATSLACIALLASTAVAAEGERWYRVELLVFTNEAPAAASAEQWNPTPLLAYPGAARFLVDPQQVQANIARYRSNFEGVEFESVVDEYGRQLLAPVDSSTAANGALLPGAPSTANKPAPRPLSPVYSEPVTAIEVAAAAAVPTMPTPYSVLGSDQQEFRGKAAYMQRLGRYRTLFHRSWAQPLEVEARSLPIILDGSGDTGQWPQLQGSVKLYLSRYAHLETNLWLNTDGSYLPGQWRMPAPPLGPPSIVIEEPVLPEANTVSEPVPVTAGLTNELDAGLSEAAPEVEAEGPVYPYRHAVTLQQKRRMRSGEVHYIDHPMFGIVIKLTPLTAEDLASLAATEHTEATQAP